MANPNSPFGLRPVRHYLGGIVRENEYTIADGYSTALYQGDPVLVTGTGNNVGIATAGSSGIVTGVFNGCRYVNTQGDTYFSKYWPASQAIKSGTTAYALVYDDPFILYEIMFDATGIVAADIRQLADFHSGTGDSATGRSGWYAAYAAGSENQLKIMQLADYTHPGGLANAYGAYAVAWVMLGKPELIASAPVEE